MIDQAKRSGTDAPKVHVAVVHNLVHDRSVQLEMHADGTRYRVIVAYEPQGGWLVVAPDLGWTGVAFSFHPVERDRKVHFDRAWGARLSKVDRGHLARVAWLAIEKLLGPSVAPTPGGAA